MKTPWYSGYMNFSFLKQETRRQLKHDVTVSFSVFLQLYHVEPPVSQAIAPVTYMWRPSQIPKRRDEENGGDGIGTDRPVSDRDYVDFRKLWVWIHGSSFTEGYAILKVACQKQVVICCFLRLFLGALAVICC